MNVPGGRMGQAPCVSVIMAVRDAEASVSSAIESILDQTLDDLEFVVVDDDSSDGTASILDSYAQQDDRMVVLKNDVHRGLAASLNRAVTVACAPYIARMDADDVSKRKRLERQRGFLEANPEVDVVGTAARYRGSSGSADVLPMPETHRSIVRSLPRRNPMIHPTVMGRRAFWIENPYDETLGRGQDYELWVRTSGWARFHNLPEILLEYGRPPARPFASHWQKFMLRVRVGRRAGRLPTFSFWAVYHLIRAVMRGNLRALSARR